MNGYFYLFYNSDVASIQNLSNKNKKLYLVLVMECTTMLTLNAYHYLVILH